MIQKIGLLSSLTTNNINKKSSHYTTNTLKQEKLKSENNTELKGVPKSYISFKGTDTTSLKFTNDAEMLIDKAKAIAIEYKHTEITPYHIIQAAIIENEERLAFLSENPDADNPDKPISTLHGLVNQIAKKDVLVDQDEEEFFIEETAYFKEQNTALIKSLPSSVNVSDDITLSDDIKTELSKINAEINPAMLLGTAFNTLTHQGIEYPSQYLVGFQSLGLYRTNDEVNEHYLEAYDNKAIDVWNKLALGSSMFILAKHEEEKNRLIASIANTLDCAKHGNFNKDNTYVYSINPISAPADIIKEIENIKVAQPDKKLIFMIDMDDIIAQSIKENPNGTIEYKPEIFQFANLANGNAKILLFQNDETNFQFMMSDNIKKTYSKFINYYLPPIRSYEVNDILKKNKDFLKDIKKPFYPDAREKAIILAEKMEGCYPDKAVDLMKRISEYYGDEVKKITAKDVEEFAYIATDLFNKDSKKSPIVYDTGKTLATYYGKETTKKDIENIVKQIKTGRIGTRGFVISSKDEEAGAGKKYTAEVIAGEAKIPFLEVSSSDFATSIYDDEMKKIPPATYMTKIFNDIKLAAKQNPHKTAIVYINNFDDFTLSSAYYPGYKQAVSQLSREMEKAITEDINILVIGSSNEAYVPYLPLVIKDFAQNIVVDSPARNKKSRKETIENIIKKENLPLAYKTKEEKELLINKLVKITEAASYIEIKNLINKTAQIMLERNKKKAGIGEFIEAYLQISTGRTSHPEMPDYNKKATTSHECGHATNLEVMNNLYKAKGKPWFTSRTVDFITLDPRGGFLGAVFEGKTENTDYPFEAMFSDIVCAYGGHSCEKEFFDMDGSSGIAQDLAQATAAAKRGVEYFGLGFHTGKISNATKLSSGKYNENVYKDIEVILTNAQIASDLITEQYKDFNTWFTNKYSKLIGSNNCMIDGDEFRKILNDWIASQSSVVKEELGIVEDIILDIIKSTKNGKIYPHIKKLAK